VMSELTWKVVEAGTDVTCGITTTDELYCWGFNDVGQIGDGLGWQTSLVKVAPTTN
jgi:alpha-tubulin suppressor-like RCC1 family protein